MNKGKFRRILTIIIIIGVLFGIVALSVNPLRFHTVYRQGMNIVKNDPAVLEYFGSPIRGGLFVLGTTQNIYDGGGSASLRTPLSGPKARGTISILGTQVTKDGPWNICYKHPGSRKGCLKVF